MGRTAFVRYLTASLALVAAGCATYVPPADPPRDYLDRVVTRTSDDVTVSAVVLSDAEAEQAFDAPLAKNDIQAIWLQVENRSDIDLALNFLAIDEAYFAPAEAAQISNRFGERYSVDKTKFFYQQNIPLFIEKQTAESGFIFTNHDPGAKAFRIDLLGTGRRYSLDFSQIVPGFDADFMSTEPGEMYSPDEVSDLTLDELRRYVAALPCCVLGGDEETPGDPLNIVFVGTGDDLLAALVRRDWDLTESLRLGTSWRTVVSSVFGSRYRTSPVSPLFLFGRAQDAAFQKARSTVDERNHMRIWRAPVTLGGAPVWVGQISRDIGVKLSARTFVTHRIDPVVDEARNYLLLDLIESNRLAQYGFASGVGEATVDAPHFNFTRDPYVTDGLRTIMIISEDPVAFGDLRNLGWETLPKAWK